MKCNIYGSENISFHKDPHGNFYRCENCKSTCSCYKNSTKPRGIFADPCMRQLRDECHKLLDYFDNGKPRWKTSKHRRSLYRRLSNAMQMDDEYCHFSFMTKVQLEQAKMILENWLQ